MDALKGGEGKCLGEDTYLNVFSTEQRWIIMLLKLNPSDENNYIYWALKVFETFYTYKIYFNTPKIML